MTYQEAIDALKLDCAMITFSPMTGEILDLETVKARNELNYKCYLANKIAISCLQERIERENGCEHCLDEFCPQLVWEYGLDHLLPDFKYCPMCGRDLKGADNG